MDVVGVVAQPARVGAVRHPQHALGRDLRIAEALAVGGRGAGRRVDLGEFESLGVEVAELAGALRDPGIALGVDGDIVRLGVMVHEVVLYHAVVHGLAGQRRVRQPAVRVVRLNQRELLRQVVHHLFRFVGRQVRDFRHHHARAHTADRVVPIVRIGTLDEDALEVMAGDAPLGDKLTPRSFREPALVGGGLVDLFFRNPLRPRRRKRGTPLGVEEQADLGILAAGLDGDVAEPFALIVAGDALHAVLARRQVFHLEPALVAADHHEGQSPLVVLELDEGAGHRLAGGVADDPRHRAAVCGPHGRRRDHEGGGGNSRSQRAMNASRRHVVPPGESRILLW